MRLTRPLATVLLLLPLAAAPACRHAPSADPAATSRGVSVGASGGISGGASGDARDLAWTRSELYFGLRRPDGTAIGEDDWRSFLDHDITPRFPAGFTVLDARGQYRDARGTILREPCKLLIVLTPAADAAGTDAALAAAWCERFDQESVLRVDAPARASFPPAR